MLRISIQRRFLRTRIVDPVRRNEELILAFAPVADQMNERNAVPSNVGPRTMPNYAQLRSQGVYTLYNGIRVFAGTVADPFYIDLGAVFDSLNMRKSATSPVLSASGGLSSAPKRDNRGL